MTGLAGNLVNLLVCVSRSSTRQSEGDPGLGRCMNELSVIKTTLLLRESMVISGAIWSKSNVVERDWLANEIFG